MRILRWLLAAALLAVPASAGAASNVLSWTDNSDNEEAFLIERKAEACVGPAAFARLAEVPPNVVTFTDSDVQAGAFYCYRVAAFNTAGRSAYSNRAGRRVPPGVTLPAAPAALRITPGP